MLDDYLRKTGKIHVNNWYQKQGFHNDGIWTKGNAEIRGVAYNPAGKSDIVITTYGWHPHKEIRDEIGLKLFLNGRETVFNHAKGDRYFFNIDASMGVVDTIRVASNTFVPENLGLNKDKRVFGIDIKTISFE